MKNVFEVFLVAPYLKECAHRSNSDIGRGYLVYCSVEILAPNKERGNAFCLIVTGIELGLLCKENTYLVCNRKYHCTADIFTMKMLWLKLAFESLKKLLQLWTQAWWSLYMRAGALVLWLWNQTHVLKVVGSNPGPMYWMDMTFFHIDLL